MRTETIAHILTHKLIAIARAVHADALVPLAEALLAGGISMLELTFDPREPDTWAETCRGIRTLRDRFEGRLLVGAGTVLDVAQLDMAHDAGARYIISPDVNEAVIRRTVEHGLVSMPGCMTPSEMTAALRAGADFIKLFPAGDLGIGYVKSVLAPLSHAKVLAVGGIDERNAASFMKAGCVGLGIGGSLVSRDHIAAGDYGRIADAARACVQAVKI